ncbi:DUF2752 domain-containing protein [Uniformispora flossi]|uniref:DUF2752 domain-containing protein n=2 Tax=Uniformispora flossi TaxID=3390723 RepID=UPI003D0313A9
MPEDTHRTADAARMPAPAALPTPTPRPWPWRKVPVGPPVAAGWGAYPYVPPPPRSLPVRLLAPVVSLAGLAAATTYVGLVDPNRPGHYPVCPLLRFTGLYCPGCGGLRCVHALAHADIPAALGFNAFAVAMLPVVAVVWLRWAVRTVRGLPRTSVADPRLVRALVAGIILFAVVRNLPFGAFLAP